MHAPAKAAGARADGHRFWNVTREWQGETAFVVCGGPSVLLQDTEKLRGRRVVAINSSYQRVPFADMLYFSDRRWWNVHRERLMGFRGRIVTSRKADSGSIDDERKILELERLPPPGLATRTNAVTTKHTGTSAVLNLLAHLGVRDIITLGLDGKRDKAGRSHHHDPHQWAVKPGCWVEQAEELRPLVSQLARLGISVRNASPGSAFDFWPIVALEDVL